MLKNFNSHETVTCNGKDYPGVTKQIKAIFKEKNQLVRNTSRRTLRKSLKVSQECLKTYKPKKQAVNFQ